MLKMYLHIKNEVSRSRHSKVRAWIWQPDTQTDTQRRNWMQLTSRICSWYKFL